MLNNKCFSKLDVVESAMLMADINDHSVSPSISTISEQESPTEYTGNNETLQTISSQHKMTLDRATDKNREYDNAVREIQDKMITSRQPVAHEIIVVNQPERNIKFR